MTIERRSFKRAYAVANPYLVPVSAARHPVRTMASNTGLISVGELEIARSISAVAVCCSKASLSEKDRLVSLEITVDDPALALWPWEYMWDETAKKFICQEFHPICRGLLQVEPAGGSRAVDKLRILLLIGASPTDTATLPLEYELHLKRVFHAWTSRDLVDIDTMKEVLPEDLATRLHKGSYDVVHFYGHAKMDPSEEEGYLKFERVGQPPVKIYANEFAQILAPTRVRLAILNGCETGVGSRAEAQGRSSIAAALTTRGIAAVIATQFQMPTNNAAAFSGTVYTSLVDGDDLEYAVRAGRQAMQGGQGKFVDWGIPVLYAASPEGLFFNLPLPLEPTAKQQLLERIGVGNVIPGLSTPGVPDGAIVSTPTSPAKSFARVVVALADLDTQAGFLPEFVEIANTAQSYYAFKISYPPIPSGSLFTLYAEEAETLASEAARLRSLDMLEEAYATLAEELDANLVCCMTSYPLGRANTDRISSYAVLVEGRTAVVHTAWLRAAAVVAQVHFTTALFVRCLTQTLMLDTRWGLTRHEPTGCILDDVEEHMFAEQVRQGPRLGICCRQRIHDRNQLNAIDALLALAFAVSKSGVPAVLKWAPLRGKPSLALPSSAHVPWLEQTRLGRAEEIAEAEGQGLGA